MLAVRVSRSSEDVDVDGQLGRSELKDICRRAGERVRIIRV